MGLKKLPKIVEYVDIFITSPILVMISSMVKGLVNFFWYSLFVDSVRKSGPCNRKKTANRTDLDRFGPDCQLPVAYVSD